MKHLLYPYNFRSYFLYPVPILWFYIMLVLEPFCVNPQAVHIGLIHFIFWLVVTFFRNQISPLYFKETKHSLSLHPRSHVRELLTRATSSEITDSHLDSLPSSTWAITLLVRLASKVPSEHVGLAALEPSPANGSKPDDASTWDVDAVCPNCSNGSLSCRWALSSFIVAPASCSALISEHP